MPLDDVSAIDNALQDWRQGDVCLDRTIEFLHLADLTMPHSPASCQVSEAMRSNDEAVVAGATPILEEVAGIVVVSQTCDVVRTCTERPFVEVAPLVQLAPDEVENVRKLKRPAFAYIPAIAAMHLVADLDRVMTVEKALVSQWTRTQGCQSDAEQRAFARAVARKRSRFAFPDDFVDAVRKLQAQLVKKHDKLSSEGAHLRALREIRVRAAPSWSDDEVQLTWWFVKHGDPESVDVDWTGFMCKWLDLFDWTKRFRLEAKIACKLEGMTAQDYVESDILDLDRLSVQPRQPSAS